MPIDPLVLAMMSGGGGQNAAMMDPTYAAAIPRLQLAQQLMQEGTSAAPAYPMQGVARVIQSLAGNVMMNKAMQGLAGSEGGAAQAAAATLPDGHPLKAALTSSNPLVQFQAMQAYKAALTQMGEPYSLNPGQQRNIGNTTIAQSTAPQSPEGKLQADIASAGANGVNLPQAVGQAQSTIAANSAPGEATKAGQVAQAQVAPHLQETYGRVGAEQNARQRQADYEYFIKYGTWPQSESWYGGAGPQPSPAAPPAGATSAPATAAPTRPQNVPGTTPKIQPAVQEKSPEQSTPPQAQSAPPAQPGKDEPLITPAGTAVPPLSMQPRGQGSAALDSQQAISTEMEKNMGNVRAGLEGTESRLMALGKALQDVQSGGLNEKRADISNDLRGLGLGPIADMVMSGQDTAAVQKAIGLQTLDVLGQLKQINQGTGGRILATEFSNMLDRQYGPDLSPQANYDLITQALGGVYQTKNMINDYLNYGKPLGWRDANAFQSAYLEQPQNKMDSMIDYSKKALGPLKGMPPALPEGAKIIGTYQGKQVIQMPDGSKHVAQ